MSQTRKFSDYKYWMDFLFKIHPRMQRRKKRPKNGPLEKHFFLIFPIPEQPGKQEREARMLERMSQQAPGRNS